MKHQILIIHGGNAFASYKDYMAFLKGLKVDLARYRPKKKWKDDLIKTFGKKVDILAPKMPSQMNAQYKEWKILFGKIARQLENNVILIGPSLGGIFLAKYLSESRFPKKIKATMLIAAPYSNAGMKESLGSFILPKSLKKFEGQAGKIFLYQSKDDPVVPSSHVWKYKKALPEATVREFKDRGHFNIEKFPELIKDIKSLFKN